MVDEESTATSVAGIPLTLTIELGLKLDPEIVITVPPPDGPEMGWTLLIAIGSATIAQVCWKPHAMSVTAAAAAGVAVWPASLRPQETGEPSSRIA